MNKMFSEQERPKIDSNKIERQDIEASFQYLQEIYQKEFEKKDSKITPEILESNIDHTKRVIENAKRIAEEYKKQTEKLLKRLETEKAKSLEDFKKVFDEFVK